MKKGFSLLELLVVILIIGILAAVALPQYKMAVLKSKFSTIKNITRAIYDSEQRYYLINNKYTTNWNDLDIERPIIPCKISDSHYYIMCFVTDIQDNRLLRYVLMTQQAKTRCDAFSENPNSLTNQICQMETKKQNPNYCSELDANNYCSYYY